MANLDTTDNWKKIQLGVKETEKLIGKREYNLSMTKARQTLEFMVRCLGEKACIVDGDLKNTIDELYESNYISKATMEHYHTIRMIGNKAIHEGNENAYDANQAYHLLSQEVYTFANEYNTKKKKTARRSSSKNRSLFSSYNILKFLIVVMLVLAVIAIIKFTGIRSKSQKVTEPATTTAEETTVSDTLISEETESTTIEYKAIDNVNVRKEPSTDAERIGVINSGDTVHYLEDYDDTWAKILYNGSEAYISKQYIKK